jgi:hypothetical protein
MTQDSGTGEGESSTVAALAMTTGCDMEAPDQRVGRLPP